MMTGERRASGSFQSFLVPETGPSDSRRWRRDGGLGPTLARITSMSSARAWSTAPRRVLWLGGIVLGMWVEKGSNMAITEELEELTKGELYELAQKRDVEGRSSMDKAELVQALADGAKPPGDGDRSTTSGRAVWRGAITFGLITLPVGLYTATEDRDVSFHLLSAEDGARIRYKRVNPNTDEEVDWDDIVRGFEYEEGRYVTFTDEELDRIPSDSVRAIDVLQFAQAEEIDPIYFERSYYIAPEPSAVKAYEVLREALQRSERVGISKVTIRKKERLCTLRPKDDVLVLETMKWPDEIRIPDFEELEAGVEATSQEVEMAQSLIDHLSGDFDPASFHDSYRERLEEAIARKIQGEEIQLAPDEGPEPEKVTDLMEALRASVEASRSRRSA